MSSIARWAFIEDHHDLRPKRRLYLHRNLGRQELLAAIEMGTKLNSVFGKFPQVGQRKDLKPSGIRKK